MAYATVADIRARMKGLPASFADGDILSHIEQADTIINGYLYDSYDVPFSPVPEVIETISINLAIYLLHESLYSSFQPNQDQFNVKRYERVMEMLKMISEGSIVLEGYPITEKKSGTGFDSTFEGDIFFTIDPDEEW
jgi:phage gp36-like protein